jgi:hypothetical protein
MEPYTNSADYSPHVGDTVGNNDGQFVVKNVEEATGMLILEGREEPIAYDLVYLISRSASEPATTTTTAPAATESPAAGGGKRKTKRRKKTKKSKWNNKATIAVLATAVAVDKSASPEFAADSTGGKSNTRKKPRRLKKRVR